MTETANYGAQPTSRDATVPADIENFFDKYSRGMRIVVEGAQADTGQTPKETVWTKNKAKLYHYAPAVEKKHPVPILMVYALINRPYILDLLPRAVKKVLRHSGSDEFTLLGYCMGGTMSAMYASLFPEGLKNLVLLTAPIDFPEGEMGLYSLFTSEKYMNPGLLADAFGNIPGELIDTGNRMLKPVTNYVGTYVNMWERIFEEKPMETWLAMNKWVNDGPPFPGATFRQWISEFYQQNKLSRGEIVLRGRRVDLSNIKVPLLNIAGTKDHICALPQAEATMSLVGSEDKEFFPIEAGHVGLMTGRGAKRGLWPKVSSWLGERSGA